MTVWDCIDMITQHNSTTMVRIFEGEKELTDAPISCFDVSYGVCDNIPKELFEAILEKTAKSIDLEKMIIYCQK